MGLFSNVANFGSGLAANVIGAVDSVTPGRLGQTLNSNLRDPGKAYNGATNGYGFNANAGEVGSPQGQLIYPITGGNDPAPTDQSSWGSDGSGSYGGYGSAAAQQAALDAQGKADTISYLTDQASQLQRLLGSLRTAHDNTLGQLNTNYENDKTAGVNKYNQQFQDNTRSKMGAFNQVDTKARTGANSLARMLGLSGSSGQSAGMVANSAVARQASMDRGKALENSALNERNITNSRDEFLQNLLNAKREREQGIQNDFLANEQDYNSKIADIEGQKATVNGGNYAAVKAARQPYQAVIEDRQNQIDGLFSKYAAPLNTNAKLAELSQFNVDPTAINANRQMGVSDGSPYAQFLARKRQQTNA